MATCKLLLEQRQTSNVGGFSLTMLNSMSRIIFQALAVRGLCTCLALAGFFVRDDAPYTTLHRPSNAAIIL